MLIIEKMGFLSIEKFNTGYFRCNTDFSASILAVSRTQKKMGNPANFKVSHSFSFLRITGVEPARSPART